MSGSDRWQEVDTSSDSDDTGDEFITRGKQLKPNVLNQTKTQQSNKRHNSSECSESNPPTKRQKCYSKNALLARENRMKKKMYIEGLESEVRKLKRENKTLNSILDNQSLVMTDLRKEIKYLKGVVANSSDLSSLLRAINNNTGMSVTTSLDRSLTLKNNYVSKKTAHPWIAQDECSDELNPSASYLSDIDLDVMLDDPIISGIDQPDDIFNLHQFETEDFNQVEKEHNYTITSYSDQGDDGVGICLHVSKHKVSLEFCATCSERASQTWQEVNDEAEQL